MEISKKRRFVETMKNAPFEKVLISFIIILFVIIFAQNVSNDLLKDEVFELKSELKELEHIREEKNSLETKFDSQTKAVLEHYSKCSFIDKASIEVGYDNYLRKKTDLTER